MTRRLSSLSFGQSETTSDRVGQSFPELRGKSKDNPLFGSLANSCISTGSASSFVGSNPTPSAIQKVRSPAKRVPDFLNIRDTGSNSSSTRSEPWRAKRSATPIIPPPVQRRSPSLPVWSEPPYSRSSSDLPSSPIRIRVPCFPRKRPLFSRPAFQFTIQSSLHE